MKYDSKQLKDMADTVRGGALYAVRTANSGHIGIAMGAADIITTIYANHLGVSDEFILSAGHGSAMLYSVLKLSGYNIQSLKTFRAFNGLPGHPEYDTPGVSATTGPLGQGIGNAVGIALGKKISDARTIKKSNGTVYCLCSDGDLMEGVASESIGFAGRYKLNNLVILWDDNKISIDGVALTDVNIPMRMRAAGFETLSINGNNFAEIDDAIETVKLSKKPVFIQCKTIIGLGTAVAGTCAAHAYDIDELDSKKLEEKFTNANGIKLWANVAKKFKIQKKLLPPVIKLSPKKYLDVDADISTRELSGLFIEKSLCENNLIIGGSADLSASTKTKTPKHRDITADDFSGNFINYGVREHAMGAIMNGLAASGFRPYGGTFLAFSDYMRPAIRLAALSKIPTIFVFTHDSIALGEDGPTHQPIEQIASLRLVPNLNVFRPCNMAEVAAAWEMALSETSTPSCIILSRQKFPQIKSDNNHQLHQGGYIIFGVKNPKITIIATGAEVPLATAVASKLGNAQVVSMLSVSRFRENTKIYKNKILRGFVVVIEAGATPGWFEFADAVMGIDTFGKSGPGTMVYKHFGFDADIIANEIARCAK